MARRQVVAALLASAALIGCGEAAEEAPLAGEADAGGGEDVGGGGEDGGGDPAVPTMLGFEADIRPLIERSGCLGCHGGIASYYMGSYLDVISTGVHAPLIIPCDPDGSPLVQKVRPAGPYPFGGVMPPNSAGIAPEDLAILRQWIAEGAQEVYTPGFCE